MVLLGGSHALFRQKNGARLVDHTSERFLKDPDLALIDHGNDQHRFLAPLDAIGV